MTRTIVVPFAIAMSFGPVGSGAVAQSSTVPNRAAAQAPGWNSGYGWWPGGFGYAPLTIQAHNYPCSVTAYGPTFNYTATSWNQNYGGGTSCAS